jgi:hypothetical protein
MFVSRHEAVCVCIYFRNVDQSDKNIQELMERLSFFQLNRSDFEIVRGRLNQNAPPWAAANIGDFVPKRYNLRSQEKFCRRL